MDSQSLKLTICRSVLMEWAECGSLDDLIDARQGHAHPVIDPTMPEADSGDDETTRTARIRAFKATKKAHRSDGIGNGSASRVPPVSPGILLLSAEEIKNYLSDIVSGLAFLVSANTSWKISANLLE
jgi:hypothetical protein